MAYGSRNDTVIDIIQIRIIIDWSTETTVLNVQVFYNFLILYNILKHIRTEQ